MHKISIIIPIYNVDKYLSACIETVIHQTYQNLEIILVNDGSTDICPQICDDYAAKDQRIIVIHKKNGGLSDARNAGMKIATGDYISFVDSDDLLSLDFYQNILNALIKNDADVVECGFVKFEKENELKEVNIKTDIFNVEIYETENALLQLLNGPLSIVVWNKMYKKNIVKGIEFPFGKINEDAFWTYKIFAKAKKIAKISAPLYFYRQQSTSIMGADYSLKRLDGLEGQEEMIEFIKTNFPNLEYLAIKMFCNASMFHYQQLSKLNHIDSQKKYRRKIFINVKRYNKWSVLKKWHWKDVVWFLLFIYFTEFYMYLRDYMEMKAENF